MRMDEDDLDKLHGAMAAGLYDLIEKETKPDGHELSDLAVNALAFIFEMGKTFIAIEEHLATIADNGIASSDVESILERIAKALENSNGTA